MSATRDLETITFRAVHAELTPAQHNFLEFLFDHTQESSKLPGVMLEELDEEIDKADYKQIANRDSFVDVIARDQIIDIDILRLGLETYARPGPSFLTYGYVDLLQLAGGDVHESVGRYSIDTSPDDTQVGVPFDSERSNLGPHERDRKLQRFVNAFNLLKEDDGLKTEQF